MKALSTLLRREVEVVGAGRTDAGVHASLMVAHFDSDSPLDKTSSHVPSILLKFLGGADILYLSSLNYLHETHLW